MTNSIAKTAVKAALRLGLAVLLTAGPTFVFARDFGPAKPGFANETPRQLQNVGIDEQLGTPVDLDQQFFDESGRAVTLREFFRDGKPVLLSLAYYSCKNICSYHLNGLSSTFKRMKYPPGREFNFVVVSIDPREKSELAAAKKASFLGDGATDEQVRGWNFLVGDEQQIRKLASTVGFKYRWDDEQQEWAHSAAAYVLTPAGRISRYLYGIDFDPQTVRLSLIEASEGQIGTIVDKLILFCFHFDPKESKYTLMAMNVMRLGGGLAVIVMAAFLLPFWWRSRRTDNQAKQRVQGEV